MKKKKIILSLFIFLCLYFSLFLFFLFHKDYKVSILDVGQGDACLIKVFGKNILIDGGPDNSLLNELGNELGYFDRKFDYLIISHFHSDHITGLIEVLSRYKVKNLVYGNSLEKFSPADILFDRAKSEKINLISVDDFLTIKFSNDCNLFLFNPERVVKENDNNSLISKLECRGLSLIGLGDNELAVEQKIISLNLPFSLKSQIFKASHHGSNTSNSLNLIQKISPDIVVIYVGDDNKFNHPAKEVMKRFDSLNLKTKRTDKEGTIDFYISN